MCRFLAFNFVKNLEHSGHRNVRLRFAIKLLLLPLASSSSPAGSCFVTVCMMVLRRSGVLMSSFCTFNGGLKIESFAFSLVAMFKFLRS